MPTTRCWYCCSPWSYSARYIWRLWVLDIHLIFQTSSRPPSATSLKHVHPDYVSDYLNSPDGRYRYCYKKPRARSSEPAEYWRKFKYLDKQVRYISRPYSTKVRKPQKDGIVMSFWVVCALPIHTKNKVMNSGIFTPSHPDFPQAQKWQLLTGRRAWRNRWPFTAHCAPSTASTGQLRDGQPAWWLRWVVQCRGVPMHLVSKVEALGQLLIFPAPLNWPWHSHERKLAATPSPHRIGL